MTKPTIFFSHSSADKDSLTKLKDLFVAKTGSTIDVFLSSDGQSIPFGRNWVRRVQEALDDAKLMFVFVTAHSLRSNWIYFEAGYAHSKGIRVVPVGFLNTDLKDVPAPLALLQGFNIGNEDGLDNLIAIANDEFKFKHDKQFTNDEYDELLNSGPSSTAHPLRRYLALIDVIDVVFSPSSLSKTNDETTQASTHAAVFSSVKTILTDRGKDYSEHETTIISHGFSFTWPNDKSRIAIQLDPTALPSTLPLFLDVLGGIRVDGITNVTMLIQFLPVIDAETSLCKISGRLHGNGLTHAGNYLVYDEIGFAVEKNGTVLLQPPRVVICPLGETIALTQIASLLDLLFDSEILYPR